MEKLKEVKRESNLEILRIISMIMIIMHHYAYYSGFIWEDAITVNRIIVNFFQMFGKLGVVIFILISGYFYDKTKFKLKKLLNLFLQVWFFSIIGLIIGIIIDSDKLNITNIIKSIFPISFSTYWFASCYILIYIFSPFLKKIVNNISKRDYKILLTIMLLIWFVYATIQKVETYSNVFITLIVIYLIGGYLKKYDISFLNSIKNNIKINIIIIIIFIMNIIMIGIELFAIKIPFLQDKWMYFNGERSIFVLILAILLFSIFKNLNIKNNKIINKIATTTFGIYLVHENVFFKDIIWNKIIQGNKFANSPLLILNGILGGLGVFIISAIIYWIIEKIIIINLIKIIEKICNKVKEIKLYDELKNKVIEFYNK